VQTPQIAVDKGRVTLKLALNLGTLAVTRGKRLVVLVVQKKAIAIAVRNTSGRRRWSKLGEWLRPRAPVSRQVGLLG
jgi:hypothetical protein